MVPERTATIVARTTTRGFQASIASRGRGSIRPSHNMCSKPSERTSSRLPSTFRTAFGRHFFAVVFNCSVTRKKNLPQRGRHHEQQNRPDEHAADDNGCE